MNGLKKKDEAAKTKKKKKSLPVRWALITFVLTLGLSAAMTYVSSTLIEGATFWVALSVLVVLILLGVVFDMLGVAVTSASPAPFVAMASKKVKGAKNSLAVLKHAEKFSNFCNDVVGDICGVVSGTAGAAMAALATARFGFLPAAFWSVATSAVISALTVSMKALGKGVAMNESKKIVELIGRILAVFSRG
jgi:flagellar basal body-associated protein FliL